MQKIANTGELKAQLQRLAAECQPGASREGLAASLRSLADRLAAKVPDGYAAAKKQRDSLEEEANRAGKALKALSGGGAMGMTPDAVRATPEWKRAKRESDEAFKALQDFNEVYVKRFKDEIRQDRRR